MCKDYENSQIPGVNRQWFSGMCPKDNNSGLTSHVIHSTCPMWFTGFEGILFTGWSIITIYIWIEWHHNDIMCYHNHIKATAPCQYIFIFCYTRAIPIHLYSVIKTIMSGCLSFDREVHKTGVIILHSWLYQSYNLQTFSNAFQCQITHIQTFLLKTVPTKFRVNLMSGLSGHFNTFMAPPQDKICVWVTVWWITL